MPTLSSEATQGLPATSRQFTFNSWSSMTHTSLTTKAWALGSNMKLMLLATQWLKPWESLAMRTSTSSRCMAFVITELQMSISAIFSTASIMPVDLALFSYLTATSMLAIPVPFPTSICRLYLSGVLPIAPTTDLLIICAMLLAQPAPTYRLPTAVASTVAMIAILAVQPSWPVLAAMPPLTLGRSMVPAASQWVATIKAMLAWRQHVRLAASTVLTPHIASNARRPNTSWMQATFASSAKPAALIVSISHIASIAGLVTSSGLTTNAILHVCLSSFRTSLPISVRPALRIAPPVFLRLIALVVQLDTFWGLIICVTRIVYPGLMEK